MTSVAAINGQNAQATALTALRTERVPMFGRFVVLLRLPALP
jgi:hypothetical protein